MARDEVRRHYRGDNYALVSEPRTPTAHAASHVNGTDDIQLASATVKGLMSTAYASKLDGIEAGATDDSALANYLPLAGGSLSGTLNISPTQGTAPLVAQPIVLASAANQQALALNPTFRPTVAGVTSLFGLQSGTTITDNAGVSNNVAGPVTAIWTRMALAATYSGTVGEVRGITVGNPVLNGGSGVITTSKGIHIENMTTGLTNWGLYVAASTQCFFGGSLQLENSANLVLGTGAGSKIGTATTQKLALWNATPIVQPAAGTDLKDVLETTGLLGGSGVGAPLNLDGGALTVGAITASGAVAFNGFVNVNAGASVGGTFTNLPSFQFGGIINISANFVYATADRPILIPTVAGVTQTMALQFIPDIRPSAGTSFDMTGPYIGIFARCDLHSTYTGTVGSLMAIHIANPSKNTGTGVITNNYGLYIENQTSGVNNFAIYVAGANTSRFGGSLLLADSANIQAGTSTGTQIATAITQKLGLWGATPIVRPVGWTTPANYTVRKTYDRTNVTLGQLADYVATLEAQVFKLIGMLGA